MITKEVLKIFSASVILALFASVGIVFAQTDISSEINSINTSIDEKRSSIDQISRQIDTYKEMIEEKQAEEVSLYAELDILGNRVAKTELEIEQTDEEIDLVNDEIRLLEVEMMEIEDQLSREREMISDVLRQIQVVDNDLPLQTLLGTDSLAELFDELEQLETVNTDLQTAVDEAHATNNKLQDRRENEENKRTQLEELEVSLVVEKELLEAEQGSREILINETQKSEAEFQSLLNQLRQEESFINQQILLLQAEIEGKLSENDEVGDSSVLSWPINPTARGVSAYFHDVTYPFRHLFEHSGIDLPAPTGTAVESVAPGYVAWTRQGRLYGNYVMIIHSNGVATLYAHLSRIDVGPDQFVSRGQVIGAVGNTGFSTGPHLHFEVRKNGIPTNPLDYLIAF